MTTGMEPGAFVLFDRLQHLQTVHLRQLEIEQHHFRLPILRTIGVSPPAEEKVQGGLAVLYPMKMIREILFPERPLGEICVLGVVFDEENLDLLDRFHLNLRRRKCERYGRAFSDGADRVDGAAVTLYDTLYDRESDAGTVGIPASCAASGKRGTASIDSACRSPRRYP